LPAPFSPPRQHGRKAKRTTNIASINSKEVAGLPVPLPDVPDWRGLLKEHEQDIEAARLRRIEAAELRQSAWSAFESTLFDAAELSAE
jgi:type I restriction enzyme S subunit